MPKPNKKNEIYKQTKKRAAFLSTLNNPQYLYTYAVVLVLTVQKGSVKKTFKTPDNEAMARFWMGWTLSIFLTKIRFNKLYMNV